MNDTISHAFIPGRLAKQKVVQAELEEKLSKSEENLNIAQTKSNVSRSFHRKRSQVESIGVKHHNLVKHEPCLDIKAKPLPFVRNLLGVQKVSIKVIQLTFEKEKSSTPTSHSPIVANVEPTPVPGPAVQKQKGHGSVE